MIERAKSAKMGWLAGFLSLSFGAGFLGSTATMKSVNGWYRFVRKPTWTPPNWVFGPVWTSLYAMMAFSAWRVKQGEGRDPAAARAALVAWLIQIGLNLAWSIVFFGKRRIGGGVVVIAALWAAIAACLIFSSRVSKLAAWLLSPYLAWVSFAAAINYRVWTLNRGLRERVTRLV